MDECFCESCINVRLIKRQQEKIEELRAELAELKKQDGRWATHLSE